VNRPRVCAIDREAGRNNLMAWLASGAHDDTPAQTMLSVSNVAPNKRKNAMHNDMKSGTIWTTNQIWQ
jgi:hypothetical protein